MNLIRFLWGKMPSYWHQLYANEAKMRVDADHALRGLRKEYEAITEQNQTLRKIIYLYVDTEQVRPEDYDIVLKIFHEYQRFENAL